MGNAEPDVSIDTLTKELNEADLHLGPLLGYARFIRRVLLFLSIFGTYTID